MAGQVERSAGHDRKRSSTNCNYGVAGRNVPEIRHNKARLLGHPNHHDTKIEGGGAHVGFPRVAGIRLRPGGDKLNQAARQRHLGGAISLEGDRRAGTGQLCEALGELTRPTFLDHHVEVGLSAIKQAVPDEAADHPGRYSLIGGGSFEETQKLPIVYWLIRAHSTAPTCPARSPSWARRRTGLRAGLMNGDERSVSRSSGCTRPQERVTPPPITNISGSITFVRLIRAFPM